MRWATFHAPLDAPTLVDFLRRLIRGAKKKVFLIMDDFEVRDDGFVQAWLLEHEDEIEGLPLPFLKHHTPLTTDFHLQNHGHPKMKAFDLAMKMDVESAGATFVSALDVFCDAGTCRASLPFAGDASLTAFDYGHLTEAGALVLARQVLAASMASQ